MSTVQAMNRLSLALCSGQKIRMLDIPGVWAEESGDDFSKIDEALKKIQPQDLLILRIGLNAPLGWLQKHPAEVCVYWGGPSSEEEIVRTLGSKGTMDEGIIRKQTPRKVRMSAFWSGPLPPAEDDELTGRKLAGQSISSTLWALDAADALKKTVLYIEKSPYAGNVLGYAPAFGHGNENIWWGSDRQPGDFSVGDFGISHSKRFARWCAEHGLDASREPSPGERISFMAPEGFERFLDRCEDEQLRVKSPEEVLQGECSPLNACYLFRSQMCAEALERFRITLQTVTGKPCGLWRGEGIHPNAAFFGLVPDKWALPDAYDFILSPVPCGQFAPGDTGISPFIAKNKPVIEVSTENYQAQTEIYAQKDEQFCVLRDALRCLSENHRLIQSTLPASFRQALSAHLQDRLIPAQVLVVDDAKSNLHMAGLWGIQLGLGIRLEREVRLCGAAVDTCLMEEMGQMDLSTYRLIIFKKAFALTEDEWKEILPRIPKDACILWNWAAGLLSKNQKTITGFETRACERLQHSDVYHHVLWQIERPVPQDYPRLCLMPQADQKALQTSPEGHILTAERVVCGRRLIYASEMTLRSGLLRKIMNEAGVLFDAPEHCAVYRTDRLIGFFAHRDRMIEHSFDGQWRNMLTNEAFSGTVCFGLREKAFALFEKISE